jgi:hypothetical protein
MCNALVRRQLARGRFGIEGGPPGSYFAADGCPPGRRGLTCANAHEVLRPELAVCRGAWTRATVDQFRHSARQTC